MRRHKLSEMTGGWFVGDFDPGILRTPSCEVAVKSYMAGQREPLHVHRIAAEVTLVVSGEVEMVGERLGAGDMILLEPGEPSAFQALSDAVTVVVKLPSAPSDKYVLE